MNNGVDVFVIRTSCLNIVNYNYLLTDHQTGEVLLIDPSWEFDKIKQAVENLKGYVRAVLLTHSHVDHVNLAERFARELNADIYMGKREITDYGFSCTNLIPLSDGDTVCFGESKIKGIHTPGHTSGSMCFQTDEVLFTGDTIFIEGCGNCSSPGGSADDMYYSIQRLKELASNDWKIYPAHSYGKPVGCKMEYVKKHNIYFNLLDKKYFVDFRMRPNQTGLFNFK